MVVMKITKSNVIKHKKIKEADKRNSKERDGNNHDKYRHDNDNDNSNDSSNVMKMNKYF